MPLSELTVTVSSFRSERALPRGPLGGFERATLGYFALSFSLFGGLLASLAYFVPPLGFLDESLGALQKSNDLRKGGDSSNWFFLAMAHWHLGEKDEAGKWYDRGVQWMEKNQPKNEELRRFRVEAAGLLGIEPKKD